MIPPRYIFEGDEDKARALKGFAQSQLEILRNAMSFQSLAQDKRSVKFSDGTIIDLNVNHGLEVAVIYCPPVKAVEEEVPEEVEEERPWLENPGSKLRQKSNANLFLCAEYPAIEFTAYPQNIARNEERGLVLQGGIYPYFWSVVGEGYWFDKDFTLKETEGYVLPPICLGGDHHGTMPDKPGRGGIMQSQCEAGGGLWLYRGEATLFTDGTVCSSATVSVIDICKNTGKVVIPWEYYLDWDEPFCVDVVKRGSSAPLAVKSGVSPYTWEALTEEAYTLSRGGMTEGNPAILGTRAYLNAPEEACAGTVVQVTDDCGARVSRMVELEQAEDLTWDYVLSDEEADQNNCAAVFIRGGTPPYTWESSDPEFVLDAEVTSGSSNSVCLSATACGTTIITVTDICGNVCTGAVRSTAGQWVKKQEGNSFGWGGTCYFHQLSCGSTREIIIGERKWLLPSANGWCVYYRTDDGTSCGVASIWGGPQENHPPCTPLPVSGCHEFPCAPPAGPYASLGCVYRKYVYYEWEC